MQEAAKKKPGKYIFHYNTVLLNIYLKVFNHYACIGTYVEQDLVALLTQILSKTYSSAMNCTIKLVCALRLALSLLVNLCNKALEAAGKKL